MRRFNPARLTQHPRRLSTLKRIYSPPKRQTACVDCSGRVLIDPSRRRWKCRNLRCGTTGPLLTLAGERYLAVDARLLVRA